MRPSLLRDVSGSAYLALLISIVIMGLTLTLAAKQLSTVMTRAKEADLLARGLEIQNALEAYAVSVQKARVTPNQTYPSTLEELTRLPKPFLRRVYTDPMTNGEWDYLRDERGHIRGVKSRSGKAPFKQRDFPAAVGHFQGLGHYSDWVFQYPSPSSLQSGQGPRAMQGAASIPPGQPGGMGPGGPRLAPPSSPSTPGTGLNAPPPAPR